MQQALFNTLIAWADDQLVLGHRLSEWTGKAHALEEELALANMGLDLVGQARNLYQYAAEVEGLGRDEDQLAYLRTEREFRNLLLLERPNTDFAHTVLRQFYYAAFMQRYWAALTHSTDPQIAAIAAKATVEMQYHRRHSAEWVVRLGDGTDESARRMAEAVDSLHRYTDELFDCNADLSALVEAGVAVAPSTIRADWQADIESVFTRATLALPDADVPGQRGGRAGLHTEFLGFLLAEMQYLQRSHPGQTW
ncbi:MAG: 1,2-phenylacetyl-CoA epoxidase subunit PaaC [Pseudomonadota bacterium]